MNGIPELTRDAFGKDSVGMGVRVGVVHKDQIDHDHHEQDARSQSDAGKRGGSGRQIIAQRHRFRVGHFAVATRPQHVAVTCFDS